MHSRSSRPFLSGLVLLGSAAVSFGAPNSQLSTTYSLGSYHKQLLPEHTNNVPTQTVLLELDGDFRKDAVVLSGGNLYVSWAVGSFMSPDVIPTQNPIRGMAVLPGLNSGDPDRLITTGADGALSWTYSQASQQFVSTNLNLPNWQYANKVVACDVDGDGNRNDLITIGIDAVTIGVVRNAGVASSDPQLNQEVWPTFVSLNQGSYEPVLDFTVGDILDGTSNRPELVLLRADDVYVFEFYDGPVSFPINTVSAGSLAVVKNVTPTETREELAVTTKDPSTGLVSLRTIFEGSVGLESSPIRSLQSVDVVGLSAGDIVASVSDEDGMDELAFVIPTDENILIMKPTRVNGHIHYVGTHDVVPLFEDFDTFSQISPILDDVDGDELLDVVYVATGTGRTAMIVYHGTPPVVYASSSSGSYTAPGRITLLTHADNIPGETYDPRIEVSEDPEHFNVKLMVNMPVYKAAVPHLEIVTWVLRQGSGGINQQALYRSVDLAPQWNTGAVTYRFTIDQSWGAEDSPPSGSYPTVEGATDDAPMAYSNPPGETPGLNYFPIFNVTPAAGDQAIHHANFSISPDIFFFEFRPVKIVNGVVANAGTSIFIAHFSMIGDWEGEGGYLANNWPALVPEAGTQFPSMMDAKAQDDKAMVEHFGENTHYGVGYEVREVDPIEIPIPWPMPPVGGPPQSGNAPDHEPEP